MSVVSRYLEPALVEHLNHMQLSARTVVQGGTIGLHRSPLKGASVEFRQHRFYTPGDELRRLDWRVLGRTDRPYVKEYDEETNLRCAVLLDTSGSMGYAHASPGPASASSSSSSSSGAGAAAALAGTKYDYAARLAAALAYLMLGQTEAVGVGLCGTRLDHWLSPHAGPTQLARVLESLDRGAPPGGPSDLGRAMHEAADRLERRSLVIVASDLFAPVEQLRAGLAHLRHDRHEVVVIQVVDRDEERFPFRSFVRLRGREGEGSAIVEPAVARRAYREAFDRHRRAVRETCLALRAGFLALTTDRPLLDAIRLFLART